MTKYFNFSLLLCIFFIPLLGNDNAFFSIPAYICKILILLFVLFISIFWLINKFREKSPNNVLRNKIPYVKFLILIFLLFNFFSFFYSIEKFRTLTFVIELFVSVLLFLIIEDYLVTKERIFSLFTVLNISSAAVSIYGIYQYLQPYKIPAFTNYLFDKETPPDMYLILTNQLYLPLSNFLSPSLLAGFLIILMPLMIFSILTAQNNRKIVFNIICFAISCMGIFVTHFEIALIIFLGVLLFIAVNLHTSQNLQCLNRFLNILAISFLLCASLFIIPKSFAAIYPNANITYKLRLQNYKYAESNSMFHEYLLWWETALNIFYKNAMLGTGAGTFDIAFMNYEAAPNYTRFAHNNYFQIGAELGFIGLLLFLGLIFAVFTESIKPFRISRENNVLTLNFFLTLSFAEFIVYSFFESIWYCFSIRCVVMIIIGMLSSLQMSDDQDNLPTVT